MLLVSIALHKILMAGMQTPEPVSVPGINALAVDIVLQAAVAAPVVEKKKPPVIKPKKEVKPPPVDKKVEVEPIKKSRPVKKKKVAAKKAKKPPVKQTQVAKVEHQEKPKPRQLDAHDSTPPISPAPVATVTAKQPQPKTPVLVLNPNYRQPPEPPEYPQRARRLRQQGIVMVRALVTPTGAVESVKVFSSSSHPLLDKSALAAVRDWEFVPARNNGQAVESWVQVPVNFVLN
jgi:protein TonB